MIERPGGGIPRAIRPARRRVWQTRGKHGAVPRIGRRDARRKTAARAKSANCCRRWPRNMICATPVFLAEFNLDLLLVTNEIRRNRSSRCRNSRPAAATWRCSCRKPRRTKRCLQTVKQAKAANLETVELFDVFRGQGIPEGQKSLAYAFTYRAAEKTLTDAEVNVGP